MSLDNIDTSRRELLANWIGANTAVLQELLDSGDGDGFDAALLTYVRHRSRAGEGPFFFCSPQQAPGRAQFINENLPEAKAAVLEHADAVMAGIFPRSTSPGAPYTVSLGKEFSWRHNPTDEPQFVYGLNRHRFWRELATAYQLTGDDNYAFEMVRQFESWAHESQPPPAPQDWQKEQGCWSLLDVAIRCPTWLWTYYLLLESPAWTPAVNTLFLHRLWQHAGFLEALTPRGGGNNWVVMQAEGMLTVALQFPEFSGSARWEEHATATLTACLQEQFHADGGHFEQSPDYHAGCIYWFLEPLYLAQLNGRDWMQPLWPILHRASEFFYQLLLPDGRSPNLSDSDSGYIKVLASAAHVLGEPKWARFGGLDAHCVWLYGPDALPATDATFEPRPAAVAFRDSGYFFLRSGDDLDARQISFDCGPKGHWHGHLDLLNFTLNGYGRPLICDPGRLIYADTPERRWLVGTSSHNTISIDGLNHAVLEGVDNPHFKVTRWEVEDDLILVSAQHTGYHELEGAPVVGRTLWFDRDSTLVLIDWGRCEVEHEYTTSFTLPGIEVSELRDGVMHSTHECGNVLVKPLLMPGQSAVREERFWSPSYGESAPAVRLAVSQTSRSVAFVTVVMAYEGAESPALEVSCELGDEARLTLGRRQLEFGLGPA